MARLHFTVGKFPNGNGIGAALDGNQLDVALRVVAELQVGRIVEAFTHGGHHRRGGTKWAPLAPSTIRQKLRRGHGMMLIRTGRLRNTIRASVSGDSQTARVRIIADAPYAGFHQDGTSRMPARPVVEVTEQDLSSMDTELLSIVRRLVNGGA